MTGAETKRQVTEALRDAGEVIALEFAIAKDRHTSEALAALAPCIVLTEEEAAKVRMTLADIWEDAGGDSVAPDEALEEFNAAYDLLTPSADD